MADKNPSEISAALEETLTCSICLDISVRPTTTTCGHTFCRRCLVQAMRTSTSFTKSCPSCRAPITMPREGTFSVNVTLWTLIQSLFPRENLPDSPAAPVYNAAPSNRQRVATHRQPFVPPRRIVPLPSNTSSTQSGATVHRLATSSSAAAAVATIAAVADDSIDELTVEDRMSRMTLQESSSPRTAGNSNNRTHHQQQQVRRRREVEVVNLVSDEEEEEEVDEFEEEVPNSTTEIPIEHRIPPRVLEQIALRNARDYAAARKPFVPPRRITPTSFYGRPTSASTTSSQRSGGAENRPSSS